ncbi:MAG: DUF1028 domain-containing protein [Planctomycetes bacterium]|nr:DUF1028 domain-containing protein [Planctomycetota bacterium]
MKKFIFRCAFFLIPLVCLFARADYQVQPSDERATCSTFSIVAYDPDTKEWGIAVASKYLAVGSAVSWAKAGVGAVATQSSVNVLLGNAALELMGKGKSAKEALDELMKMDEGRDIRQVGVIDKNGMTANYTGAKCNPWAGAKAGKNYSCQGNLLTGPEVLDAMAKGYEDTKGSLGVRLLFSLAAGEKAGGDKRGKQSAALLVVKPNGGPNSLGDRWLDFRVDDHSSPIDELIRIANLTSRFKVILKGK